MVDGKLQYLSVSQIAKFDESEYAGCNRRWWFRYIAGLPEPEFKFQELGTKVHSQIEHYLASGEDVLGAIARAGKHLLPFPGEKLLIEWGLNDAPRSSESRYFFPPKESLLTASDVPLIGFIDAVNFRGESVTPSGALQAEPGTVEIIDQKTTGDLSRAKIGDQLVTSQMLGYAEWARRRFPEVERVRLSHIYFATKGQPSAIKTTTTLTIARVKDLWHRRIEPIVEEMKSVAALKNAEDVPGNLESCYAYGGCPFRNNCTSHRKMSVGERLKMSLLSKVKGDRKLVIHESDPDVPQNGASAAVVQAEAKVPPPPVTSAPKALVPPPPLTSAPKVETGVCGACGEILSAQNGSKLPSGKWMHVGCKGAKPEAPPAAEAKAEALAPVEPKKRGRPAKSSEAKQEAANTPKEAKKGFELYVNCIPDGEKYDLLDDYVRELTQAIEQKFNVVDIRFTENSDHPLAFARWKGYLANLARQALPEGPQVAFTEGNELTQVVVEAILPHATKRVRGVR